MAGRPLNEVELASYDVLDPSLAARVIVHEIPALPGSYVGITLGRRVMLAIDVPDDGNSTLLAHELVHVRQWSERGAVRFIVDYVTAFLRSLPRTRSWNRSYRAIPAEAEARFEASEWAARRARDRHRSGPT